MVQDRKQDENKIRIEAAGDKVRVNGGGVWCVPVWDGDHVVISTENRDGLVLCRFTDDLKEAGEPVTIASPEDTRDKQRIADHKHLFFKDHHFIVFSVTGARDSYLVKLTKDLKRVKIVPVVEKSEAPTNDMFMVTDGEKLHVGHFLPGKGHRVYSFDVELKSAGKPVVIGGAAPDGAGWDLRHSNGASALFVNAQFELLAPKTLAPHAPNALFRITFSKDWKPMGERQTLVEAGEHERMVTGLTWLPDRSMFIAHYIVSPGDNKGRDDSGAIKRRIFDGNWKAVGKDVVIVPSGHRPHTLAHKNYLYLGYDSREGVFLQRFEIK